MPFDLNTQDLKAYQGRNPKPGDYDAYWERALSELDGTPPQAELSPASFSCPGVECFDLWFTGVGGAKIHARYVRPAGATGPLPGILNFHGYSSAASEWYRLLAFAQAGFAIASMDCRGQGGLSEENGIVKGTTLRGHIIRGIDDHPDKLTFRNVFLDTAQFARVLSNFDEVDANRMGCYGSSQGGGLSIVCAALHPAIKRSAPIYPFLCDYKRVYEMGLAREAYLELHEYFRRHDPTHEREDEFFTKLGYIDVQHLAPRVKAQVLMQTNLSDTVTPPSTQFAAYNRITTKKEVIFYPEYGHEEAPGQIDRVISFMLGL